MIYLTSQNSPKNSQHKLKVYKEFHPLSKLTKDLKEDYLENARIPDHNAVLSYILLNHADSIAIEVPISKRLSNGKFFIGHIDLIQIMSNRIIITDYKPDNEPMITSIPQIIAYGLMVQEYFNLQPNEVSCISFNRKQAWEFNPNILILEIVNFIQDINLNRRDPIDYSWSKYFI